MKKNISVILSLILMFTVVYSVPTSAFLNGDADRNGKITANDEDNFSSAPILIYAQLNKV